MLHHPHVAAGLALLLVAALLAAWLVPWWAIALACALATPPLLYLAGRIRRALGRRARVGAESLPGVEGVVVARTTRPELPYVVRLGGELWTARSPEDLEVGAPVLALEVEGNHLLVCRLPPELETDLAPLPPSPRRGGGAVGGSPNASERPSSQRGRGVRVGFIAGTQPDLDDER